MTIEGLAAVAIAVDAEQHLRFQLRQAIDHTARTEVG